MTGRFKQRVLLAGACLCALIASSSRAEASSKQVVPDWVHDAAKETLPAYKSDPNAVILLDDAEYTVQPNGHVVPERVLLELSNRATFLVLR